jgi:hypothetical protein
MLDLKIRFWKLPPTKPRLINDGETEKYFGVSAFVVTGKILLHTF